jgi:hypothetical protein
MRRRPAQARPDELTLEELFLTRDWVRLRVPQTLVGFGVVPSGAVGQIVKVGPTGALVRFRRKYPPTDVNLTYIDRASFVDLLPIAAQPAARLFGGWVVRALGIAITAVITLLVARAIGK